MPKYLIKANYTLEGLKGVRAKGAKSRADAVDNMVNRLGGTVESFYFAFGDDDVYVVAELPDDESRQATHGRAGRRCPRPERRLRPTGRLTRHTDVRRLTDPLTAVPDTSPE